MSIRFSQRFSKQYEKAPRDIKSAFNEMLEIFIEAPYHTSLNNHSLTKEYAGYMSLNVTNDWRALYKESKDTVIFDIIGTHDQLYRKGKI